MVGTTAAWVVVGLMVLELSLTLAPCAARAAGTCYWDPGQTSDGTLTLNGVSGGSHNIIRGGLMLSATNASVSILSGTGNSYITGPEQVSTVNQNLLLFPCCF